MSIWVVRMLESRGVLLETRRVFLNQKESVPKISKFKRLQPKYLCAGRNRACLGVSLGDKVVFPKRRRVLGKDKCPKDLGGSLCIFWFFD